ncbi:MAG: hypothetical protein V4449_00110 [Patescibacteria group bacterium]
MTSIVNSSLTKIAAIVVAVSLVAGFAFTFTASKAEAATLTNDQISSIISLLQSFGADSATIANVSASLHGTAPVGGGTSSAAVCPFTWTRSLTTGATGADVLALQKFLNSDTSTQVAVTGSGSPGNETSFFGPATGAAVTKFQLKYAAQILTPLGLTKGTAFFGASSRAKANELCASGGPVVVTPPSTGTGLMVVAGSQPMNSLSPQGATRVPFTRFTLTAGNDGDVVVNGVTVQKDGLGQDAAFAGIVLVDESTGAQLGIAKTFNSNHQTTVGGTFTIPRGTTKTFLLAGNMNTSLSSYVGEAPGIALVAVNTSATVSGSLPIVGAHNTNNSTLTVGTISLDTSNAFASNSNSTKEIGTTAHKFTGFRLTAGSAEDVRLRSITFNQAGSVSASDLANVMVNVAGTDYPTVLSSDGRYYTANLGSGIVVGKGNQVEVYLKADILGSNSSGRTVIFDVDKTTDIFGTGETYGYGISPTTSGGSAVPAARTTTGLTTETTGTPYIYAAQITVSGASVTSIGKANEVPAQNIAINLSNQPLGGYVVDMKGESVTVQSSVFTIASTTGSGTGLLTNLTIVDENGSVVAGPVDGVYASATTQTATFTDSITYKTGRHVYTIRGKVSSSIGNGGTYIVTTVPSSGWTTVRGETTGNTISLSSNGSFTMNTMTVKAGTVAVGRANSPASQAITPGGSQVLFVNFQYDATQSGEDIRFSSIPSTLTFATGAVTDLTSCAAYDGTTQLSTGSNVVNPSGSTGATQTFTLDNPVTVTKGTVKTIGIRCNVSGSATNNGTFAWDAGAASAYSFTGATSGTTISSPTDASDSTVTMTVGSGSATVAIGAGSPGYKFASAGSTGVTVGEFKLRATNEDLNLIRLGLQLTSNTSGSTTASDFVKVSIFDGATKVGEAYFTGSGTVATSTLTTPLVLARDVDKLLTLKADFANVGTSQAVTFSGHLVKVDFLNAEATGASSGTTVYPSGSTAVSGVRVFKSFPTVAKDTSLSSTGLADGELMRFKVTADAAGPVGLTELNFLFATTSVTLSNVNVYAYSDSGYSSGVSGLQSGGMFSTTNGVGTNWVSSSSNYEFTAYNGTASTTLQIPAGQTVYFAVRGSVSGVVSGSSITTTLQGASSFVNGQGSMSNAATNPLATSTSATFGNDFIWSPNSTTTAVRADADWTGGYGVSGLPQNGLTNTRSN